jgi:hypothetical protein
MNLKWLLGNRYTGQSVDEIAHDMNIEPPPICRNPYVDELQEAITKFLKAEGDLHAYTEDCVQKDYITARIMGKYNDAKDNLLYICLKAGTHLTDGRV